MNNAALPNNNVVPMNNAAPSIKRPVLPTKSTISPIGNNVSPVNTNVLQTTNTTPLLECRGLTKKFKNLTALNDINLTLPSGCVTGLLGPNGSGKTTLLRLIAGLITPTRGQALIHGAAPSVETKAVVSYLPDSDFLPKWMRVIDAIFFYQDFYKDFDRQRAQEMLFALNIEPTRLVSKLSKGTREKVQLVLTMSRNADLYLLDEPIGGVDPASRDYILHTIITNYHPNASVLISTHLIADVEPVLDSFIFINLGNIAMVSTVDAARQNYSLSLDQLFREVYRC